MNQKTTVNIGATLFLGLIGVGITFWGAVFYVVYHFINKWW